MGNINEKNSQRVDKKETEKVMLDPQGHFDPWTVRMHFVGLYSSGDLIEGRYDRIKKRHELLKR
jgi:hypothetical protein